MLGAAPPAAPPRAPTASLPCITPLAALAAVACLAVLSPAGLAALVLRTEAPAPTTPLSRAAATPLPAAPPAPFPAHSGSPAVAADAPPATPSARPTGPPSPASWPALTVATGLAALTLARWRGRRAAPTTLPLLLGGPAMAAEVPTLPSSPPFDPLGLGPPALLAAAGHAPLGWFALPEGVQEAIQRAVGPFTPLVSFMLFLFINQQINKFRREQEAKAAAAAGKAIAEATERTVRAVTPEQWGKLLLCLLIDVAGDASFLLPGLGELSDAVYSPLEALALSQLFRSNALGVLGFVEEALPFTDELPTATLGWVLETFFADSPLGKLLGLKFPEDRKAEEAAAKK
eukprot:EG_transcript_17013